MFGTLTVWLIATVVLLYAYVYVWTRGPQDGRLWRMIRRLRKAEGYWRKRALRDEAILSRVIDKKTLALVAFLCLFLIPVANPSPYIDSCTIADEASTHQETPFLTAADGDESSESITSFSETSADDTMQGMECDDVLEQYRHDAISYFDDGADASRWTNGNGVWPVDAFSSDGDTLYVDANVTDSDGPSHSYEEGLHNDEMAGDGIEMMGAHLYVQFKWLDNLSTSYSGYILIRARNSWENHYEGIVNVSSYAENTWHTVDVGPVTWQAAFASGATYRQYNNILISFLLAEPDYSSIRYQLWLNYTVIAYPDLSYEADSDTYAESFADVSDWTSGTATLSTDGDVMSVTATAWQDKHSAVFSAVASGYVEVRCTQAAGTWRLYVYQSSAWRQIYSGTGTGTIQIKTDDSFGDITRTGFTWVTAGVYSYDCLRIGPATEAGWQHDCSTTAGVSDDGDGDFTYTKSSDEDILTLTTVFDTGGGAQWGNFFIAYDTTATASDIETDYYPLFEILWRCTEINGGTVYLSVQGDGKKHSPLGGYRTSTFGWTTERINFLAETTVGTNAYLDFVFYADTAGENVTIEIDYAGFYSIANNTLTQSGAGTDDYLYVDSGVLYSHIDDGYIELNHDPALSVPDTYSVYNLTTPSTAPEFSQYVSDWSTYSDDTRGATTSGTLTDIKLKFDSTETLSAIKFIEDGTAPSVLRISATPPEPDDTESVTLSALATDTVEVYKVWFRPITGPTGYSQTDYESTEQADNLWTYEFASLDEGYWAFKAIAFDGANNSTLDADSVTDFWVREKELIISNTLYTETSTQCSFAGQTNVACDYLIYDDDAEQESGNKAAGSFFLDWTKQTSVGTHDWGIKFYTVSSTDWHNGSYEVLTTTLLVTEYGIRTTDNYAYLHGYVTLDSNYKVYEETVEVGTGSVSAGSFEIRWTKASSSVENVTVLFESGSQSYNVYSGYDVAAQVTFVVESWWMDLNLGVESYVEFYVLTTWENSTIYVYDNETLMTTVTEAAGGAYSYFWMAESQGLHIITLNITHGGTTHTRTRTYYIPDWAVTGLVLRWDLWTFQDNYTMMELESNWMNCTYYVYLNGSLVATSANDPVILNFTRSINVGEYNLTIFADGGTQTYKILNIRYIITEEGVTYDYSSVTGGRSIRYPDVYEGDVYITENPPGFFIDQATAAIVSVGGFLIIFVAFLVAREARKREILKTERVFNR